MCVSMQHGPKAWCLESCLDSPGPALLWIKRKPWRQAGWRDSGVSWKTGSCVGLCWGLKLFISTRTRMKPRHRWHLTQIQHTYTVQDRYMMSPVAPLLFGFTLVWSLIHIPPGPLHPTLKITNHSFKNTSCSPKSRMKHFSALCDHDF